MATLFQTALFGAPSTTSHEPRAEQMVVSEGINPFKVLVITLSVFMFGGFLWVCVSPLILRKKQAPAPIDPENAYFFDKDEKRPSPFAYERKPLPYNYRYRHYRSPAATPTPKMSEQWLKAQSTWTTTTTPVSLTTPPPAYRSSSMRTTSSTMETTSLSSFVYTPRSAYRATTRTASRKSTIPSIKITRSPTMPTISRPIPHPEGPLPGPRLDMESDPTFLRPNAIPRDSDSSSATHPPTVYLPTPCTAVVHANNYSNHTAARVETNHDSHKHVAAPTTVATNRRRSVSNPLPDNADPNSWRFSQFFVDWDRQDDSVASSISASKIGIAL